MSEKHNYTDEAWWEPPLFDWKEEEIVKLFEIVRDSFLEKEEDIADRFFDSDKVPPRIFRRLKQFEYRIIYDSYMPNSGGNGLAFLIDKYHKQTVLVGGTPLIGYYYFVAYLPDRRIGTVWPYVEESLFGTNFFGATTAFINEEGKFELLESEPWDASFWTEEFGFTSRQQLSNRFIKSIKRVYSVAPEDWYLREFYPTADDWLRHAIGYEPPKKKKRRKKKRKKEPSKK